MAGRSRRLRLALARPAGELADQRASGSAIRALREFISRNYQADARGRWYFQNGPQRVFVSLAYTPLVIRFEGEALVDHCGRPFRPGQPISMTRARF